MTARLAIETKQDYAYKYLRQQIISGGLLPGQRVVVNRIADEIGTSIIPIREALVRLESEGLVTIKAHSGAVVALMTKDAVLNNLEALAVLEGYATRLALPHAPAIITELESANERMRATLAVNEWEEFNLANRTFHHVIYGACKNDILVATIGSLWVRQDTYLSTGVFNLIPDRATGSVAEHEGLVNMLKSPNTDPYALELAARTHKLNTAQRFRVA